MESGRHVPTLDSALILLNPQTTETGEKAMRSRLCILISKSAGHLVLQSMVHRNSVSPVALRIRYCSVYCDPLAQCSHIILAHQTAATASMASVFLSADVTFLTLSFFSYLSVALLRLSDILEFWWHQDNLTEVPRGVQVPSPGVPSPSLCLQLAIRGVFVLSCVFS